MKRKSNLKIGIRKGTRNAVMWAALGMISIFAMVILIFVCLVEAVWSLTNKIAGWLTK